MTLPATPPVTGLRPAPALRDRPARTEQIIRTARDLVETEGADALTMRRLGEVLGIRAPSLYKHLSGKGALTGAVVELALLELGSRLHEVITPTSGDATGDEQTMRTARIERLLATYREVALGSPHLYRLATAGPLAREELSPGVEDWAGEPFLLVTGEPYIAQALWSAAHGTVILELDGRYPAGSDLDRTWAALAAAFGSGTGTAPS